MRSLVLKRAMDIVGATVGLLVLAPITLTIALIVRLTMGPPVLFAQTRLGLHGKPFLLYKFRTMSEGRAEGDSGQVTPAGRWLRRTSLDELPELYNVLVGQMSLVGPRPLLVDYLELYTPEQARRHEIRPGLTGWAQVNGRNAITWHEKFQLDVWYVDHWDLWLDLKAFWLTLVRTVRREGIGAPGHDTTMPRFEGQHGE